MDNDKIAQLANDLSDVGYYRLAISSREAQPGFWIARGTVYRQDSDEEVDGAQVSGESEEEAMDSLFAPLLKCVLSLSTVPREWNKTELRSLLQNYRKFNDELTSILASLQKSLASGGLDSSMLHASYWKAREAAAQGSISLARRLAALSESDRVSLMSSDDEVYLNQSRPQNLDDLDSRSALFDFILEPSEAVVIAHELHLRRWGADN